MEYQTNSSDQFTKLESPTIPFEDEKKSGSIDLGYSWGDIDDENVSEVDMNYDYDDGEFSRDLSLTPTNENLELSCLAGSPPRNKMEENYHKNGFESDNQSTSRNSTSTSDSNSSSGSDSDDDKSENDSCDEKQIQQTSEVGRPLCGYDDKKTHHTLEDGRALSAYEIQRLERIRRNRDYLAQLGLHDKDQSTSSGQVSKSHSKVKKIDTKPVVPTRERISRQTKDRRVSYVEPGARFKSDDADNNIKTSEQNNQQYIEEFDNEDFDPLSIDIGPGTNDALDDSLCMDLNFDFDMPQPDLIVPDKVVDVTQEEKKKWKRKDEQMDLSVFKEIKRIKAHKNQVIREAEKLLRAADKEVQIWSGKWKRWGLKWTKLARRRQLEEQKKESIRLAQLAADLERQRNEEVKRRLQHEISVLGSTVPQLLREIDTRMPDIVAAAIEYDEEIMTIRNNLYNDQKNMALNFEKKGRHTMHIFSEAKKSSLCSLNCYLDRRLWKGKSVRQTNSRCDSSGLHVKVTRANIKKKHDTSKSALGVSGAALEILEQDENVWKQKCPRDVGGWQKEEVASQVDRNWIFKNCDSSDFDPSFYVPQVGDLVLYYTTGHKVFLKEYPDVVGKGLRDPSRTPLWEIAKRSYYETANTPAFDLKAHTSETVWWNEQWLHDVENDAKNCYPLLCQVQRTHAEFPVRRNLYKSGDGMRIRLAGANGAVRDEASMRLRLAVSLLPLSPLAPPMWKGCNVETTAMLPPPAFTVVMFPTKLDPYVVPFFWAYTLRHSLTISSRVRVNNFSAEELEVKGFSIVGYEEYGNFSLEDKRECVNKILSRIRSNKNPVNAMKNELGEEAVTLFEKGTPVILDLYHALVSRKNDQSCCVNYRESNVTMLSLILSTLPLWKGVMLTPSGCDSPQEHLSPWGFTMPGFDRAQPWSIGERSISMEQVLREKLLTTIMSSMKKEEAADFIDPVDEENVTEYYCAVPLGSCLSSICKRLIHDSTKSGFGESYRSAGAVLEDVRSIVENCLLYNQPDSQIFHNAVDVVSSLEAIIRTTVIDHNTQVLEARGIGWDCYTVDVASDGRRSTSSKGFAAIQSMIDKPFPDNLNRTWVEQCCQAASSIVSPVGEIVPIQIQPTWIPQAGDMVLYSETLHQKFVEGHRRFLHPYQSQLQFHNTPNSSGSQYDSSAEDFYRRGRIAETSTVFPRNVNVAHAEDDGNIFLNSPIFCVLIEFPEGEPIDIYWQPCEATHVENSQNSVCPLCGIPFSTSFLQHDLSYDSNTSCVEQPGGIPYQETESIIKCLSLLKQRCIDNVSLVTNSKSIEASFLSDRVTRPVGLRDISRYCVFGRGDFSATVVESKVRARLATLIQSGFIPFWIADDGSIDIKLLRLLESSLVNPKLCLDFILLRLQCGFYRNKEALKNDILEAFVSVVSSRLVQWATKMERSISIENFVKLLSCQPVHLEMKGGNISALDANTLYDGAIVESIRKIRHMYSIAMVCVTNTDQASFILGLQGFGVARLHTKVEHCPVRALARLKIGKVMESFDINANLERGLSRKKEERKPINVKFLCNGKTFANKTDGTIRVLTHAIAMWRGKAVKVKFVCAKKEFPYKLRKNAIITPAMNFVSQQSKSVRISSIPFYATDCKDSERLSKLLFANENCQYPCGRCRVKGQSFFSCRVMKSHSNPDFDWFSVLGGVGGIDGLVRTLRFGDAVNRGALPSSACHIASSNVVKPSQTMHDDNTVPSLSTKIDLETLSFPMVSSAIHSIPLQNMNELSTNLDFMNASGSKKLNEPGEQTSFAEMTESSVSNLDTPSQQLNPHPTTSLKSAEDPSRLESDRANTVEEKTEILNSTEKEDDKMLTSLSCQPTMDQEQITQESHTEKDDFNCEEKDPTEFLEEAKHLCVTAEQLLYDAQTYSEAPIRLSADFVDGFPVDDDDGHYIYCIVCGLIGDLLCCDGCPNTVHHHCIGLSAIPDGDWFCEECNLKKKPQVRCPSVRSAVDTETRLPFGRLEFDYSRIEDLTSWLDELREKRGVMKQEKIESIPAIWNMDDQDEEDTTFEASVTQLVEESTSPLPKRRGRPPKNATGTSSVTKSPLSSKTSKFCRNENEMIVDSTLHDTNNTNRKRKRHNALFIADTDDDVLSIESTSSVKIDQFQPRCYHHGQLLFVVDGLNDIGNTGTGSNVKKLKQKVLQKPCNQRIQRQVTRNNSHKKRSSSSRSRSKKHQR